MGVIQAEVVTVTLDHILAPLQRVPVVTGLAQRGGKARPRVEPVGILPAADGLERRDDLARDVE